jgi:broad specificity phosphatase PhoE
MTLTVHFLRHGQTALSREDVFCGSGLNPELTPEGLEMAHAIAKAYRNHSWTAIFSSCLQRSTATARPLCDALGMSLEERPELNEIAYGRWEGMSKGDVERAYHDDYVSWLDDPAWHAPTGGETAVAIARRGLQVLEEITNRFSDGNILVVSHKATIRIVLCALLGIDLGLFRYRLACPVGGLSIVEFASHGPQLLTLADRSHLSKTLQSLPGT